MPGIGIDLVEISRIAKIVERSGKVFLDRVFTQAEQEQGRKRGSAAALYASTFAAKEAVFKLFGTEWTDGDSFLDIEILREESGAPSVRLHGRFALLAGNRAVFISLSSDAGMAIAAAMLL